MIILFYQAIIVMNPRFKVINIIVAYMENSGYDEFPHDELIPSMKRRMSSHDYTERRMYLITMNVSGRRPLLGLVKGRGDRCGAKFVPSPLGEAVERQIVGIPDYYPQIEVKAQQLMPDHLHMILFVKKRLPVKLGIVIRGFVQGCNKAYRELCPSPWKGEAPNIRGEAPNIRGEAPNIRSGAPNIRSEAPNIKSEAPNIRGGAPNIRSEKSRLKPTSNHRGDGILFEHGYNDRLLTHEGQLACWERYLADNPRRLWEKRQHPDLFRVQRNLRVKGMTFSAIGNKFLLDRPLVQVQCSRSLPDEAVERETMKALATCKAGAVLVSPCVSRGEKTVMRAAFEAGFPEIILVENGFIELAKPGGQRFDACAKGQLLILAPWEHHNDRRTITRSQCLELNEMARRLCQP